MNNQDLIVYGGEVELNYNSSIDVGIGQVLFSERCSGYYSIGLGNLMHSRLYFLFLSMTWNDVYVFILVQCVMRS